MEENKQALKSTLVEFILLTAAMIVTPLIVASDTEIFLYGSSEVSSTELVQEALILLSAILFGLAGQRHATARGWLVLVAGLFICMFLREIDFWLDKIAHGFWIYPAALTAIASIAYSLSHRENLLSSAAAYASTRSHAYIASGILVVALFSRLAGTSDFWIGVMGDNYHAAYKTFMQEGLELLGYFLIALGSASYYFGMRRPISRR